jgi:LPS export ABC transporter permease LptG
MLIPRYVVGATLPYVLLSMLMLSAVLFVQQASRFAEVILYTDLPLPLLAEVGAALFPGVLVFTIPIGTLAGIIIGFSRMGSDSEIVAMRSAGVGAWTMIWPVIVMGFIFSLGTTFIHMKEAPRAARDLERVALEGALAKLDSPVEPRTFSTLPRYVIYVRDGDKTQGIWGRVFIYSQQPDKSTEIFTARSGKIDSSGATSELVLSDVLATKFPGPDEKQKSYVVERSEQLRISINTGRGELINRLNTRDPNTDAKDWRQLRSQAASAPTEKERREGQRVLYRRLALSISPLVFAFLGGALGLRVRRGGRSIGIILSLTVVMVYYLTSLIGETLARIGTVPPILGLSFATVLMLALSIFFLVAGRFHFSTLKGLFKRPAKKLLEKEHSKSRSPYTLGDASWGFPNLLDASVFRSLALSFLVGFVSLVSIFNIFTLFELWRFIAVTNAGAALVARYLLFLLPLVSVELFPATMLIAVLVTYALMAKRREAIAWWASGQSVYRLMLPGLMFAIAMALCSWLIQEHVMPGANLKQDALRARIKGGEARVITRTGRQWLASTDTRRFYSYEFSETNQTLLEPTIYELDADGVHLARVINGKSATWTEPSSIKITDAEVFSLKDLEVERQLSTEANVASVEAPSVFRPTIDRPSQLSATGLTIYLNSAKRRGEDVSAIAVALQKKYASPFSVVIMAFIGIPLAISFGRKGTIIALCAAVVVSIAYWGVGGGFQQLGNHGMLRPSVAGWSPLLIFAAAGTYFLSKVRT